MDPHTPLMTASTNNIQSDSLDCGIKALGWCSGAKCQNLATTRNFVIIFSIICALHGAVSTYFRISVQQAGIDLGYDPYTLDWLFATIGLAQGILGLFLIFYSQRFHPMSWISGFVLFEAALCIIAIIPSLHFTANSNENHRPIYEPPLCDYYSLHQKIEKPHSIPTLALLFILHAVIGLTGLVMYCIGYPYMDDNVRSTDSATLFGCALASYVWGSQIGSAVSLQVDALPLGWWFGWIFLVPLLIVFGILIGLFPRKLLRTIVRQAAYLINQRISQSNIIERFEYVKEFTFLPTMCRLFTNKILLFNLLAFTFMETSLVNYFVQEENYMQSRFYIQTSEANGLHDEWTSRFLLVFLKPIANGLAILIFGFILSRLTPKSKNIALWNVTVEVIVCACYISYIFLHCSSDKLGNSYKNRVVQPYCSSHCSCGNDVLFTPVCPREGDMTYFSPCHAGCQKYSVINNYMIFQDCTCGANPDIPIDLRNGTATAGACHMDECQKWWLIYQIMTLFAGILLASCEVGRMLITFRSVSPQDKPLALALEATLSGIVVHIPGKLIYDYIATSTCQYWSRDASKCYLNESPLHGNILNIVSAILLAIAATFDILVSIFIKDLDCFTTKYINYNKDNPGGLQPLTSGTNQNDVRENVNSGIGNITVSDVIQQQPQHRDLSSIRQYQDSSPDSSVLQNSPRRIGGRRSHSPVTSQSSIIYAEIREESPKSELRTPRSVSPQNQNLNYAQVMFEFKRKKPQTNAEPTGEQTENVAGASAIGKTVDEHLDFRLQEQNQAESKISNDADADDELSEVGTSRKNGKFRSKETSF